MKTLYISDLDGTLLDKDAKLSATSRELINQLTDSGVHFTCATARTAATVTHILNGIHLTAPAVLMNGVAILDWNTKKYMKVEYLQCSFIQSYLQKIKELSLTSFIYSISEDELISYYEYFPNHAMEEFYSTRATNYHKRYQHVNSLSDIPEESIAYSLLLYPKESLQPLVDWLDQNKTRYAIDYCLYPEIYYDSMWCLEIFHHHASKRNAVNYLRKQYGYDKIIGFGDNLNDLSLFDACDEAYAVSNAKDAVKAASTSVIEANTEDSVPRYIHFLESTQK